MKKLYILRHAKSDYPDDVSSDKERPLNKRGEKACDLIGQYLKENNIFPEIILSSDAVRTTQTINNVLRIAEHAVDVSFTPKLYLATPGEILKEIVKVDAEVSSVMVVCHNPGVEQLSAILTGGGDADSISRIKVKYPTAGMACFTIEAGKWGEVNPGCGHLDSFITPKALLLSLL